MTEPTPLPSDDQYAHIRGYATTQKQATVDRLTQAIAELEAEHRPNLSNGIRYIPHEAQ
jgi:hypothetical protein